MRFTRHFLETGQRPDRSSIEIEWIERTVSCPEQRLVQEDGRIRVWSRVPEAEGRWLLVVLLEDGVTVPNALLCQRLQIVKIRYFRDTDTLYIEFRPSEIVATRDLDENTLIEFDAEGQLCALTIEHARDRADIPHFSFEQVAA